MKRYCGRDFTQQELEQIRELIAEDAGRTRAELSRLTCQRLNWFKPDGGLKDMSCRVAMLRMAEDGLIILPPPRRKPPPRQKICFTEQTDHRPKLSNPFTSWNRYSFAPSLPVMTRDFGMNLFTVTTTLGTNPYQVRSSATLSLLTRKLLQPWGLVLLPGRLHPAISLLAGVTINGKGISL